MKSWPTKGLCELAEVQAGFAWKAACFSDNPDAGPPVVRIQNLGANDNAVFAYYNGKIELGYWIDEGDLLVSLSGSFKVCRWQGPKALLNQRIVVIRPCQQLNRDFAFFQISERLKEISNAAVGIAVANASMGTVRDMEMSVPPLAEQERIVKLLDEADELRKLRVQADHRAANLIPALFHEMFGDSATNEKKWPVVQLSDIITRITNGYVGPTRDIYHETGVPYILSRHIKNNQVHFDGRTFISPAFNQRNVKSILRAGDVLLVQTGHIGEAAVVPKEHEGHNCHAIIVMSPVLDKLVGEYLCFWLTSESGRYLTTGIQTGATLKHLNCGDVKKLRIMLPPVALQKEFAKRVTEIRELEVSQATSRTGLDALFQSMLHRAFNGEL